MATRLHRRPGAQVDEERCSITCRAPTTTAPADPEAREKMANASTHGGHGIRKRVPGRVPFHGAQARRIPPPAARRGQRADDLPKCCASTRRKCRPRWAPSRSTTIRIRWQRYAEVRATICGIGGKDRRREARKPVSQTIEELKAKRRHQEIPSRNTASDERSFLEHAGSRWSKQAFDDQCTGANPRYPLLKEIKAMYLKAYYGEKA